MVMPRKARNPAVTLRLEPGQLGPKQKAGADCFWKRVVDKALQHVEVGKP